jgi:pilus assembly protein CpaC
MIRKLLILVIAVMWPHIVVAAGEPSPVRLLVGRSAVVDVGTPITRVSLTSADVADALVTAPDELLVNGKTPGTVSMFVWDRAGEIRRYEVIVQRDLSRLAEQVKTFFPGEDIDVEGNGRNVVLSGQVSSKDVIENAVNLAAGYVEKREEVVTLLQIRDGAPSNQVLLRVRFAEVSRNALTELGASFAANGFKDGRWYGRTSTQQFAAPQWDQDGKFVFSDFLNLFLFDTKNELAGVIRALQNKGLFQSLAEPNLVAESGKEASFLAGGEIPVPIAQGSGNNLGITVQYKEFGIRLNFTPVVNGDRIHLKVRPEVSTLDFNNAVVLQGFRIPALSTRRTETELELRDHQTFAIAGLLNNTMMSSLQKVPGLGDIPILGLLFRSKAAQKDRTELVVMITPEILPNNSPGVTTEVPRLKEPYLPPLRDNESTPPPPPPFMPAPSGSAEARPAPSAEPVPATSSAAAAAAAVSALSPSAPKVVPVAPVNTVAVPEPAQVTGAEPAEPEQTVDAPAEPEQAVDGPAEPAAAESTTSLVRPLTAEELERIEKARQKEAEARAQNAQDGQTGR